MMGIGLLAGPANVIMQLARPGIGYGVKDSRVESGRVDRHPIKRARTTFTYIAVAISGTDDQKAAFRRAVNRAHAQVYSRPDRSRWPTTRSTPTCNCGSRRACTRASSTCTGSSSARWTTKPPTSTTTTLHGAGHHAAGAAGDVAEGPRGVRRVLARSRWTRCTSTTPSATTSIRSRRAGRRCRCRAGCGGRWTSFGLLITTGFLPQRFRDEMRLPWDARRQRRFDRLMKAIRVVNNLAPKFVRRVPVQRAAARSGLADQDGTPAGLSRGRQEFVENPSRLGADSGVSRNPATPTPHISTKGVPDVRSPFHRLRRQHHPGRRRALAMAALIAAGPASAGSVDNAFLAQLEQDGITPPSAQQAIKDAKAVCSSPERGLLGRRGHRRGRRVDRSERRRRQHVRGRRGLAYCPEYVEQS